MKVIGSLPKCTEDSNCHLLLLLSPPSSFAAVAICKLHIATAIFSCCSRHLHPLLLSPSANPISLPSSPPMHNSIAAAAFYSPTAAISTSDIFLPSSLVPVATYRRHLPLLQLSSRCQPSFSQLQ
ncbi:hypothetical protein BHM03_00060219 [Ensete ventricosum]|nr:hypothetical protein BHM03_00060219 [Ensete ventricosum]